jgi:protein-disulfide isomerase
VFLEVETMMIQLKRRAQNAALGAAIYALTGGILGSACQKKEPEEATPAAAVEAEGSPCDKFVTQLCGRSGETSQLCSSGKAIGAVLPASACLAALEDFPEVETRLDAERKVCNDLIERLCKDIGPTTDSCGMVREQTPQFPTEKCAELTQNYDQIVQELKQKEALNLPLTPEAQAKIAAKGAPSFGPDDAKVTIVEFSDFECPFCTRAADVTHKIRERYGDKVRVVFRQFPLPMHQQAHLAAQAALAAADQGKFWEFHDLLFANQRALTRDALEGYAKQLNLNVASLKQALDKQTHKAAVDADLKLGDEVNVSGTPTLFINGKRVPNPTEFAPVAKLIDEALGA